MLPISGVFEAPPLIVILTNGKNPRAKRSPSKPALQVHIGVSPRHEDTVLRAMRGPKDPRSTYEASLRLRTTRTTRPAGFSRLCRFSPVPLEPGGPEERRVPLEPFTCAVAPSSTASAVTCSSRGDSSFLRMTMRGVAARVEEQEWLSL